KDCRRFFAALGPKVKVKDWEKRLGGVSYTVRLLTFLKKKYPAARFSIAVGSDAYRERRAWKNFSEVRRLARLIVFPRGPRSRIPNVSSTAIRALQARKRLR